jgi:hypothetical protein
VDDVITEVLDGVFHWRTPHPNIGSEVDSFWLEPEGVLIDPLVPREEGLDWFAARPQPPRAIVLCNRHHYRDSASFLERFQCGPVHVPEAGLHEFTARQPVSGYRPGDNLPGGLVAVAIGALAPDDGALYLPRAHALWFADSVVRAGGDSDGPLGFVPDYLMDDPPGTKRGILAAIQTILGEFEVENVLMAHGGTCIGGGGAALEELVGAGGRTAEL